MVNDPTPDERKRELRRESQRRYRASDAGRVARRRERRRARLRLGVVVGPDPQEWKEYEGLPLTDEHQYVLLKRAVSAQVAATRGYHSVHDWDVADSIGHERATSVASLPALAIPVHDVHGAIPYYLLRPDKPRFVKSAGTSRGKAAKYPAPKGTRPVLDVHPSILERVLESRDVLYVVEGVIKADSAVSRGLLALGLTAGVWGWKSGQPLAEWDLIPLQGRPVNIVFDTDIRTNPGVRQAAHALEDHLLSLGAHPTIQEIPVEQESFGLDDFFRLGRSESELRPIEEYKDARDAARALLVDNTSAARGRYARPDRFTPAQLKVGLYLLDKMRSGGQCNASIDEMAKDLELSAKTVQDAVNALKTRPVGKSKQPLFLRHKGKDWAARPLGHRMVNGYAVNLGAVADNTPEPVTLSGTKGV